MLNITRVFPRHFTSILQSIVIPLVDLLFLINDFLIGEKSKHSNLLMFQRSQQAPCASQTAIFCLLASPHHIWLVSKILMHNSSDRVPWKSELLSNGINWSGVFLSIIYCTFRTNLDVLVILGPLLGVLRLAICWIPISGNRLFANFNKWPCNF